MQEIVTEIALMLAVRLFAVEIHELSTATHDALVGAPSMGQFNNANIKGSGSDGPYDAGRIGAELLSATNLMYDHSLR